MRKLIVWPLPLLFLAFHTSTLVAQVTTTLTGTIQLVSGNDSANLVGGTFTFEGVVLDAKWESKSGGGPGVDVATHSIQISGSLGDNNGSYFSLEAINWYGFPGSVGKWVEDDHSHFIDFTLNDSTSAYFAGYVYGGLPGAIDKPVVEDDWGGSGHLDLFVGADTYRIDPVTFVASVPEPTTTMLLLLLSAPTLAACRKSRILRQCKLHEPSLLSG